MLKPSIGTPPPTSVFHPPPSAGQKRLRTTLELPGEDNRVPLPKIRAQYLGGPEPIIACSADRGYPFLHGQNPVAR